MLRLLQRALNGVACPFGAAAHGEHHLPGITGKSVRVWQEDRSNRYSLDLVLAVARGSRPTAYGAVPGGEA